MFNMTLMCGGNSGSLRITTDTTGEAFFASLEKEVKRIMKRTPQTLSRDVDYVRLAYRRDISGETHLVYLAKDQVEDSWMEARQWIQGVRENSSYKIYAIIETD
jgi:archaellum component FlaC